jgi:hypothetical protein
LIFLLEDGTTEGGSEEREGTKIERKRDGKTEKKETEYFFPFLPPPFSLSPSLVPPLLSFSLSLSHCSLLSLPRGLSFEARLPLDGGCVMMRGKEKERERRERKR